jgi:hypothetical protein
MMKWTENVACAGEMRNAYKTLGGKRQRKRALWRPWCTQENNRSIKKDFREIGCDGVDWIELAQEGILTVGLYEQGNNQAVRSASVDSYRVSHT